MRDARKTSPAGARARAGGTLAVAVALAALVPSGLRAQGTPVSLNEPVLQPGDQVQLIVWRNAEMSGEFDVSPDSTLGHPILRAVKVAGIPLSEAEERLRVFLGRYETNPNLVLLPRYRVFVGGEVASPGFQLFAPTVSLAEAVMLAGRTDRSKLEDVTLVRGGQEQVVDLTDVGSRRAQQLVRSGDQLLVPRRHRALRDILLPTVTFLGAISAIANFVTR